MGKLITLRKVIPVLAGLSAVLIIVSIGLPYWYTVPLAESNSGLFQTCSKGVCTSLDMTLLGLMGLSGQIMGVLVCLFISMIMMIASFAISIVHLWRVKQKRLNTIFPTVIMVLALVTMVFLLIACILAYKPGKLYNAVYVNVGMAGCMAMLASGLCAALAIIAMLERARTSYKRNNLTHPEPTKMGPGPPPRPPQGHRASPYGAPPNQSAPYGAPPPQQGFGQAPPQNQLYGAPPPQGNVSPYGGNPYAAQGAYGAPPPVVPTNVNFPPPMR